jgi:hypothetical protein
MFILTFLPWLAFAIIGSGSEYFLTWSFNEQLLLSLVTCFGIVPFFAFVYIALSRKDYFKISLWLAFYASFPLIIYDLAVSVFIYKKGVSILFSHWYLTAGYFYVWVIIPLAGKVVEILMSKKGN